MKMLESNLFRGKNCWGLIRQTILFALLLLTMRGAVWAAPDGTTPVWKLELVVKVADLPNAGTDDFVSVSLNNQNLTWMNYARDDFERNSFFTYNLRLEGVTRLSDITQILIRKGGNDGLCIDSIALGVNGNTFYTENLNQRWFDNETSDTRNYLVDVYQLITNPYWQNYGSPEPSMEITRAELEHRIEGLIGHLTGPSLQLSHNAWRYGPNLPRSVIVTKKRNTTDTFCVELNLEKPLDGRIDATLDIDLEVRAYMLQNRLYFALTKFACASNETWLNYIIHFGAEFSPSGAVVPNSPVSLVPLAIRQSLEGKPHAVFSGRPVAVSVKADGGLLFTPLQVVSDPNFPSPGTLGVKAAMPFNPTIGMGADSFNETEPNREKTQPSPLSASIETTQADASNETLAYTVRVKSLVTESEQIKVRLALPADVFPLGSVVEVRDAQGTHSLNAELSLTAEGVTSLAFSDWLVAGGERVYTVHLRLASLPTPERSIVTNIEGVQTGYRNLAHSYFRSPESERGEMVTSQTIIHRASQP